MENTIKQFDDELTKIYSKIISLCLEYSQKQTDNIYIFGSNVGNSNFSNDVFFSKNGKYFVKDLINDYIDNPVDSSRERKIGLLQVLLSDFREIYSLFLNNNLEAPSEVRLKYNVVTGKFGANLNYDKRIEKSATLSVNDVFNEWMESCIKGDDGFDW